MYAHTTDPFFVMTVNYTCKMFKVLTPGCLIDSPVAMNSLLTKQKVVKIVPKIARKINIYNAKLFLFVATLFSCGSAFDQIS